MSPECFTKLVLRKELSHSACVKSTLSKGLGLGIVAGSAMVKLPQIFKILGSFSAEGLSFVGNLLELMAVTFTGAYSYSNGKTHIAFNGPASGSYPSLPMGRFSEKNE